MSGPPVGASPIRLTQSLQPVAIGAAVEVTKPPKPSRKGACERLIGEGRCRWGNEAHAP